MGIRSVLAKPLAALVATQTRKWSLEPYHFQRQIFDRLVKIGQTTRFGRDHNFASIRNYDDFKKNVPVRDYEDFKVYIGAVTKG